MTAWAVDSQRSTFARRGPARWIALPVAESAGMKRLLLLVFCGFLVAGGGAWSDETVHLVEIAPPLTAPGVVQAKGPHRALRGETSNGLLLLSLGGTNSLPSDLDALDRVAVGMGFQVLALDYPNSVISTAARESTQPEAFRRFREEVVTGAPVSDLVEVDRANSLEGRLVALLRYLGPEWSEFLRDGEPVWEKIVVAGHSQGSGHAAYLGKAHPLKGVLVLAGPQDTLADGSPAEWLSMPGLTPPDRFFALLHKDDFFNCAQQQAAMRALRQGGASAGEVVVLDTPVRDAHMSVLEKDRSAIWLDLLSLMVK